MKKRALAALQTAPFFQCRLGDIISRYEGRLRERTRRSRLMRHSAVLPLIWRMC
ncbi:hypothetical protein QNN00_24295 [Bacillus velezensis]|nr:hypothetical protein [Bacillus velezensis]